MPDDSLVPPAPREGAAPPAAAPESRAPTQERDIAPPQPTSPAGAPAGAPDPLAETAIHPDMACEVCRSAADDEKMLLCDGCDNGFHIFCLKVRLEPEHSPLAHA